MRSMSTVVGVIAASCSFLLPTCTEIAPVKGVLMRFCGTVPISGTIPGLGSMQEGHPSAL